MKLELWTDGGCEPNPGNGAWAYVLFDGKERTFNRGTQNNTTNNRMEFMAVIKGLEQCINLYGEECSVEVYSDSKLLVNTVNQWMYIWKNKGWTRGKEKGKVLEVKNLDLVKKLYSLREIVGVNCKWVPGHSNDRYNEVCDWLCKKAMQNNIIPKDNNTYNIKYDHQHNGRLELGVGLF